MISDSHAITIDLVGLIVDKSCWNAPVSLKDMLPSLKLTVRPVTKMDPWKFGDSYWKPSFLLDMLVLGSFWCVCSIFCIPLYCFRKRMWRYRVPFMMAKNTIYLEDPCGRRKGDVYNQPSAQLSSVDLIWTYIALALQASSSSYPYGKDLTTMQMAMVILQNLPCFFAYHCLGW